MKATLEFENGNDLNRFSTLLYGIYNDLLVIEYTYCCDDSLYNDMAIVDSVYQQLKEIAEAVNDE